MTSMVADVPVAGFGLLRALSAGGYAGLVAEVADGEVSGPVGSVVSLLAAVDPYGLGGGSRVDLIRAWERVGAAVAGAQQRALAAVVEATEARGLDGEFARHEVGAALRLSAQTAWKRTRDAADLVHRLPATLAELSAGRISYLQAAHLGEAVRELTDEVAAVVEARVLAKAGSQTLSETKRAVAAAVVAADPEGAASRHKAAVRRRRIERVPQPDAMIGWWFTLPAALEDDVWAALSARAKVSQRALRAGAGADPGLDALRVDALVAALVGQGAVRPMRDIDAAADRPDGDGDGADADADSGDGAGDPPVPVWQTRPRPSPYVPRCSCGGAQTAAVIIDLPTLFGLAENPGEIPGYGAVPAPLARAMARDRDWVRWTVDPGTRRLLDIGAHSYRPSDPLRRFVAARDRVCGFPGCNRPAAQCDCDHVVTFRHHGQTITVNLGPLCRQHHNAKTHGLWKLSYDPDSGVKTWTSPLGKTYTVSTDPVLT